MTEGVANAPQSSSSSSLQHNTNIAPSPTTAPQEEQEEEEGPSSESATSVSSLLSGSTNTSSEDTAAVSRKEQLGDFHSIRPLADRLPSGSSPAAMQQSPILHQSVPPLPSSTTSRTDAENDRCLSSSNASFRMQNNSSSSVFERLQADCPRLFAPTSQLSTTRTFKSSSNSRRSIINLPPRPVICVLGDTSSGKSSVISQLCRVELPKAAHLTTQCVTEVHLQPSAHPPRAVIRVQWDILNHTTTKTTTYPEFPKQIIVMDEDATTNVNISSTSWDAQVTSAIAAAQAHILQHQQRQPLSNSNRLHKILVHVQSPHYYNSAMEEEPLTVVDLPGLITSAPRLQHEEEAPPRWRSQLQWLQSTYLQHHTHCLWLAVHAANVDAHNAAVTAVCATVDPDATRTLVVLTKPDLIDPGAEHDVVAGWSQQKQQRHHWIKARGQAALDAGVSLVQALQQEQEFFDTVEPWASLPDRSIFGTENLQRKLGLWQRELWRDHWYPSVRSSCELRRHQVTAILSKQSHRPRTRAERQRYYRNACLEIHRHVAVSLSGKRQHGSSSGIMSPQPPLQQPNNRPITATATTRTAYISVSAAARLHEACAQFRQGILQGTLATVRCVQEGEPVLVVGGGGGTNSSSSGRGRMVRGQLVHLDPSGFGCVDVLDERDRHSEVLFEATGLHPMDRRGAMEENDVWSDGSKIYIARDAETCDALRKIPVASLRTDPSWWKEKIADSRTDDLACFLNSDMFNKIVADFVEEEWKPHALKLLESTRESVLDAVNHAIDAALHHHLGQQMRGGDAGEKTKHLEPLRPRYPRLRERVRRLCYAAATQMLDQAHQQVLAHLEVEKHPYTQDQALFEKIAAGRHCNLKRDLELALKCDTEGVVLDTQAIQAIIDSVFDRHRRVSVEDQLAEELEVVLDAYGSVASRRVLDRTPMICWECFRALPHAIRSALLDEHDDSDNDKELERCLQEDPAVEAEYQAALDELDELNLALKILEEV